MRFKMTIRRWQDTYLRYRELERGFVETSREALCVLLHDAVKGQAVFRRRLAEYEAARSNGGLPEAQPEVIRELAKFAALRSSYDTRTLGFIFEDVYHLAFDQLVEWRGYGDAIRPASECTWLYRGQRNDSWEIGAKIYRGLPTGSDREAELRERSATACRVGHAVAKICRLSFEDGMAVAQHYSGDKELAVPTWMADFSRDPWAALFFASDHGQEGDFGIVWRVLISEWEQRAAGSQNPVGALRLVVPPGVLRIDNQAGVFVVAAHPVFFGQAVPFGWESRFKQVSKLTFEDPLLGISEDTMYPPNDPFLAVLPEIRASVGNCECAAGGQVCSIPPTLFADPAARDAYQNLLTCWLNNLEARHTDFVDPIVTRAALPELARFHALLQTSQYVGRLTDVTSRSFSRLRDALVEMYAAETLQKSPISVVNAVRASYFNHMAEDQEHLIVLQEALNSVAATP